MSGIESFQRIFAEYLAEDNLRAALIEKIGAVFEEVPCIVERRGCLSSRDKDNFFETIIKSLGKVMVPFVVQALILNPGDV